MMREIAINWDDNEQPTTVLRVEWLSRHSSSNKTTVDIEFCTIDDNGTDEHQNTVVTMDNLDDDRKRRLTMPRLLSGLRDWMLTVFLFEYSSSHKRPQQVALGSMLLAPNATKTFHDVIKLSYHVENIKDKQQAPSLSLSPPQPPLLQEAMAASLKQLNEVNYRDLSELYRTYHMSQIDVMRYGTMYGQAYVHYLSHGNKNAHVADSRHWRWWYEYACRLCGVQSLQHLMTRDDDDDDDVLFVVVSIRVALLAAMQNIYRAEVKGRDLFTIPTTFPRYRRASGDCEDLTASMIVMWSTLLRDGHKHAASDRETEMLLQRVNKVCSAWEPMYTNGGIPHADDGIQCHVYGMFAHRDTLKAAVEGKKSSGYPILLAEATAFAPILFDLEFDTTGLLRRFDNFLASSHVASKTRSLLPAADVAWIANDINTVIDHGNYTVTTVVYNDWLLEHYGWGEWIVMSGVDTAGVNTLDLLCGEQSLRLQRTLPESAYDDQQQHDITTQLIDHCRHITNAMPGIQNLAYVLHSEKFDRCWQQHETNDDDDKVIVWTVSEYFLRKDERKQLMQAQRSNVHTGGDLIVTKFCHQWCATVSTM